MKIEYLRVPKPLVRSRQTATNRPSDRPATAAESWPLLMLAFSRKDGRDNVGVGIYMSSKGALRKISCRFPPMRFEALDKCRECRELIAPMVRGRPPDTAEVCSALVTA